MSVEALSVNITLSHSITPDCCGIPFWVTESQIRHWKNNHTTFYCPGCGGSRWYPGKSDEEKLKEQLAAERRGKELALRQAERAENRRRAEKAAKTRIKNRIANGVCPCCNRTFQNLAQHMANKHPDYTEAK